MLKDLPKRAVAMLTAAAMTLTLAICCVAAGITVSNTTRGTVNASAPPTSEYSAYGMVPVHSDPLFDMSGNVNETVLAALQEHLAATTATDKGEWLETTNEQFSSRATSVPGDAYNKASGALIIKLFPTITTSGSDVGKLTEQWFQIVYRAADKTTGDEEGRDVLTIWALEPYRASNFNTDEYLSTTDDNGDYSSAIHGADYTYEGNYSTSIIRNNILSDYNTLTTQYFNKADKFFATADALPGEWQSSANQTGTNETGAYLDNNEEGGTSGYGYNSSVNKYYYSMNNGMDGESIAHPEWTSTIQDCLDDKMWIPSAFETVYMGKDKDSTGHETFVNDSGTGLRSISTDTVGDDVRHGLWKLNGYDRAFNESYSYGNPDSANYAWLRSACSNDEFQFHARSVNNVGGGIGNYVDNNPGVRPAFHLDLKALAGTGCPCCNGKECNCCGDNGDGANLYELYHMKETFKRMLNWNSTVPGSTWVDKGWLGLYDVMTGVEIEEMEAHLAYMEELFISSSPSQNTINAAVDDAYAMLQISRANFELRFDMMLEELNRLENFDKYQWDEYLDLIAYELELLDQITGYEATITSLKAEVGRLNGIVTDLNTEFIELQIEYNLSLTRMANLIAELQYLNSEEERLNYMITSLGQEKLNLEILLAQVKDSYNEATIRIGILLEELLQLQGDNAADAAYVAELTAERDRLLAAFAELDAKYQEKLKEIQDLLAQLLGLDIEHEDLVIEINTLIEILEELTEMDDYFEAYQAALQRITELTSVRDLLDAEIARLEALLNQMEQKRQELIKELEEGQSSNRGMDPLYFGLIAAAVVLFIGIPIVVLIAPKARNKRKRVDSTPAN